MQEFVPGQRWVSSAELDMGLGMVVSVEHRTVTLVFPASGETRTYARQTAPLARVSFVPGDTVLGGDDVALVVESVIERHSLLTYRGRDEQGRHIEIDERALNPYIQLNRPGERLLSYQIDRNDLFELRYRSWSHRHRLAQSDLYGLTGCRTSLIPHQLYIAHTVAARFAPRVLLADEVGLGKTIEAGLIIHQQLLSERARRVLIVVPESLVHQWLVEMLRRFNLMFSIFDEARCEAVQDSGLAENPFESEQLVLCSLDFLAGSPQRFDQALNGDWDLLVIDEAHHLQWSPQQPSHEYRLVEQLAARSSGVLLLTATPEQLGRASHFARLRLLDAHRFPDLETFISEEQRYEPVAEAVEQLLNDTPLDSGRREALKQSLRDNDTDTLLDTLQHTPLGSDRAPRRASDTGEPPARPARHGAHPVPQYALGGTRVSSTNTRCAATGPACGLRGLPGRSPLRQRRRRSTGLSRAPVCRYRSDTRLDRVRSARGLAGGDARSAETAQGAGDHRARAHGGRTRRHLV